MGMEIVELRRQRLRDWFKDPKNHIPPNEKSYLSQLMNGRASFGEKAAMRLERTLSMPNGYLQYPNTIFMSAEDHKLLSDTIDDKSHLRNIKGAAHFFGDAPSTINKDHIKPANPILDEDTEFVAIRRVDFKLSAGIKGYAIEPLNGERAPIFFRQDWLNKRGYDVEHLHAIEISGPSMETSLYEGDLVVVNTKENKPIDGEVFAANYEGELVVKRFIRESGKWWLASDNPDKRRFPNKLADESCFIIGKLIHRQTERI
jgi:phage repressor protein C with HTH and peptisase S24 domain